MYVRYIYAILCNINEMVYIGWCIDDDSGKEGYHGAADGTRQHITIDNAEYSTDTGFCGVGIASDAFIRF